MYYELNTGTKKKKKHKKKMKRKHEDSSDKSSDSEEPNTKSRRWSNETNVKTESDSLKDEFDILGREDSKLDNTVVKQEPGEEDKSPKTKRDEGGGDISPTLPVMSKKGEDDNDEPPVPLLLGKFDLISNIHMYFKQRSFVIICLQRKRRTLFKEKF